MTMRDHVVVLVGGVGGAKLALGLAHVLPPGALTIIVNTADDFEHLGLHVSPDLDTVMYALADLANPVTGWGVADDSLQAMEMVALLGGPDWFKLGDRDLGTNLMRTMMLRSGQTLTAATAQLAQRLGIAQKLLPMSDHPVRTHVDTDQGILAFQEYFVRERWQPVVSAIRFEGVDNARSTREVDSALQDATMILFGPSNPYLSIDPILAVPGIRKRIEESTAPCVAVSPIIGGQAVKGPAAKLMAELGAAINPTGIAAHFAGLLDGIILDDIDQQECEKIEALGVRATTRQTMMQTLSDKKLLAETILNWTEATFS
jgi:LPPG:FO 2-phospho-L-lactate transferase